MTINGTKATLWEAAYGLALLSLVGIWFGFEVKVRGTGSPQPK